MVENFFNRSDYTHIYSCSNCSKGFIAKTKYNKPGYRDSEQYLCRYCGLQSSMGDLVYKSMRFLDIPLKYIGSMKRVESEEESHFFLDIWLTKTAGPIVVIDDSDYEPPRDPNLFPIADYISMNRIEKAQNDKMYDMTEHCRYINSDDGKRRLINRINHGDYGECLYCGTYLYPLGRRSKPLMKSYTLHCPNCSYAKDGDDDGVYFYGWIDDLSREFLTLLPSNFDNSLYITSKDSMELFERLKIIEEENEILDFKEKYDINLRNTSLTDGAKKELRKDICAFSNNKGGCIFIGVKEKTSKSTELIGISSHEIYIQEFIDQICSSGMLNPPISNVRLHKIFYNKRWYIIIEVLDSNNAPHFFNGKIPYRFGKITQYFNTENEWNNFKNNG